MLLQAGTAVALQVLMSVAAASTNISLVVMAPFPDKLTVGWDRGPAIIPGAIIAAREVNNSTEILPDFNLQLRVADSGCSATSKAKISILRDIFENRAEQVVGIIGPACSGAALAVSNLTSREQLRLIHVTSGTSPLLEDPNRSTTYATISSAFSYVQSFLELMLHNKWTNIATLQDEARPYFKQTHSNFLQHLGSKLVYTGSLFSGEESVIPLESLRDFQARVVFVFAGTDVAARLLCYAYHKDMLYPSYQWVFHDRTREQLVRRVDRFRVNGKTASCTIKEMSTATHGAILNIFHLEQENKNTTLPLFKKTYSDYHAEYIEELKIYGEEVGLEENSANVYANTYHDAVWAMAIALQNASDHGVDLRAYTYGRRNDTVEIARHLSQVHFDGMSGPISFQSDTRSVKTIIDILQVFDGKEILIGTFDRSNPEKLVIQSENASFISDTLTVRYVTVHFTLGGLCILLTLLLTLLVVLLQLANIVWSRRRTIKASSPNLSHLIFSGCYLFLVFSIIYSILGTNKTMSLFTYSLLCNAMTWCILLGSSLIFGTVCAKAWRIYRLFKHFSNQSPGFCMHDNLLVCFVILLLSIDVAVCIVWDVLDPLVMQTKFVPSSPNVLESAYIFQCNCEHWNVWVGSIVAYKGVVLLVLLIISIVNRRIKRENFKHTRNTAVLVYSMTLMGGIGVPLYFLLKDKSVYAGFVIFSVILQCTVLLCCLTLFLPHVLPILRRREATAMRSQSRRQQSFTSIASN